MDKKQYLKEWRKKNPNYMKKWEQEHKEERILYGKLKNSNYKKKCINHYGGKCKCCGESNMVFLSMDHMNNDGAKHRREFKTRGGSDTYRWIIKNNYPKGFQVLCMNCNHAKRFGVCPHKL